MVNKYLDFTRRLIASHCLLCGLGDQHPGAKQSFINLCQSCLADLPHNKQACYRCGLPCSMPDVQLCGQCLKRPPAFQRAVVPFEYRAPIKQLITGYKHHQQMTYGRLLAELLANHLQDQYININPLTIDPDGKERCTNLPEIIIPVPLHRSKMIKRGYNQAQDIAKVVARQFNINITNDQVKRVKPGKSQQQQSAQQRRSGIRGVFQLAKPLRQRRIAIIDDVITTGATATELSKILVKAGAEEIHIWAIARTLT